MADNEQTHFDTICDQQLEDDRGLLATTHIGDNVATGDPIERGPKFECPHCHKSYILKKSLNRHVASIDTPCAKRRLTQEQVSSRSSKPRWACSRCNKDCATSQSVERHISNTCWRNCDECVADGVTRCDSVTMNGPCRTCEAKQRPCTKHASAVPGSIPKLWTKVAFDAQQETHTDGVALHETGKKSGKRKSSIGTNLSLEGTKKRQSRTPDAFQTTGHDFEHVHSPLVGQAFLSLQEKETAASGWLGGLLQQSGSAGTPQESQDSLTLMAKTVPMQGNHQAQLPGQFVEPSHVAGHSLPSSVAFLRPHHSTERPVPIQQHQMALEAQFPPYQAASDEMAPVPHSSIPGLPQLGDHASSTENRLMQLDSVCFQTQARRRDEEAYTVDKVRASDPYIDMEFARSFSPSGPPKSDEQETVQTRDVESMPLAQLAATWALCPTDPVLTLRIHSNTYDKNGQLIFSILRIRCDEHFGPRLDTYCVNRGKLYGVQWMFVYRYQATICGTQQDMQITLTWDMTPNDVKDNDCPGVAMCDMDTIYVMQAKDIASTGSDQDLGTLGAAQYSGPQISRQEVDITSGETNFYQNPDVSQQWYQALEQDSNRLRAMHTNMKTTIIEQEQQLFNRDQENAHLLSKINQLTMLSKQLRERRQHHPLPKLTATFPGLPALQDAVAGHVVRQCAGSPSPQQRIHSDPSAFVAKCEAVRDPKRQAPQQLAPLQFPSSLSKIAIPDYPQQPVGRPAYNAQAHVDGRICGFAQGVAAEDSVEQTGQAPITQPAMAEDEYVYE